MKHLLALSLVSGMMFTSSSYSVNPVDGIYVGLGGLISNGPNTTIVFDGFSGEVKLNPIGGGGAFNLGYRIQKFRLEGEILYNRISYDTLTIGSCTLQSPNVMTPVGQCPSLFTNNALGFNGSTSAIYALFNLYFDFVTYGEDSNVVPYLGFGLGGARSKNSGNFTNTLAITSAGQDVTNTGAAAQGILGVSYFLDDFTAAGMDYRYVATHNINGISKSRFGINTLNFNINFAFDRS